MIGRTSGVSRFNILYNSGTYNWDIHVIIRCVIDS